ASKSEIPEALQPWEDWVTWDVEHLNCPSVYSKSEDRICYWPSRLTINAESGGGEFAASFRTFEPTWVPLPGSSDAWPLEVTIDGQPAPVIEQNGHPSVRLEVGSHDVAGKFRWNVMPQRIVVPEQIGLLALEVDGTEIPTPAWDNNGNVWLKRTQARTADQDLASLQVYRLIGDGIPLWMETRIEITVSGKSREEEFGSVLPEGWELSTVDSPIPVAIDDRGSMKAQIRAGKWTVSLRAFRTSDTNSIAFAADADPIVTEELVGFKTNPQFRIAQLEGIPTVDVAQTTFPKNWRSFSVHRWETNQPFQLVEKMRGQGETNPPGLNMTRRFWLDEDGAAMTYRDTFAGTMQRTWRLDVSEGQELGAVRVDGQAQLITKNPQTGASGVEIRRRDLKLSAIGRMNRTSRLAATGWDTNVDNLQITFALPPGWRVFAVFGADEVAGDWLTAWSLLDVFLLLVFSFAVFRLYGVAAGVIALLAFGLAYHELGAPRLTWLFLLMPLALLRVVPSGPIHRCLQAWKAIAIAILLFSLIPFIARQTQSVIYPQLERTGYAYGQRYILSLPSDVNHYPVGRHDSQVNANDAPSSRIAKAQVDSGITSSRITKGVRSSVALGRAPASQNGRQDGNLKYAATSRIQTGPAEPQWHWNEVSCVWNGPVIATQQIRPIFISLTQHRVLTVVRVALLLAIAVLLLKPRKKAKPKIPTPNAATAAILLCVFTASTASAQFPDPQILQDLKRRLTEQPERISDAAEIPNLELSLTETAIEMTATVHAANDVAVPMPGRLPSWSPISVTLDDDAATETIRREGFLWVLVPKGIHEVNVKGLIPDATDWTWTFLLRPKVVNVEAPNWKVSGIDNNGLPQSQVFFVREQDATVDRAAYDRSNFQAVVAVDRYLEIGLISKVRTVVTRLSAPGKAVSLSIPLLSGESVLTAQRNVQNAEIAIQLAANQTETSWQSELNPSQIIELNAAETNRWVERWHLVTSPIWNVSLDGIAPLYEANQQNLIPVWHPWPGESVTINLSKPVAVLGDIVTIQNVDYDTELGSRLRNYTLRLDLECSVANDFALQLEPEAENIALEIDGKSVPVQEVDGKLTLPAQPGRHLATIRWRSPEPLGMVTTSASVTLPIEASNITSTMQIPNNRWVLWADGPMRGPAVRFWTILVLALLAAFALGSLRLSPLKHYEWVLLAIGLTQVPLPAATFVVGWLFLLAWRGSSTHSDMRAINFNLLQFTVVILTFVAIGVLIFVVSLGLLGNPDMFIAGNGSSRTFLRWFQPRIEDALPSTSIVSVSVWLYRLLMLFWALWLAVALLRWLSWGWQQFSKGSAWRPITQHASPQTSPVSPQTRSKAEQSDEILQATLASEPKMEPNTDNAPRDPDVDDPNLD
ncbi:MAG: hypothetical protein ACR2NZ_08655, partial [Rubripirellula sp.]